MSKRNDLMTTEEAALYVRLSPRTLERYRVTGEGPTFLKNGRRVFYRQSDLDQWLENNRRRSTSDPGPEPDRETKKRTASRRSSTRQSKRPTRRPPVGPRLGAAGHLSAAEAVRPVGVSPRIADARARWFAAIEDRGLAKC